jgi:ADP-dependent NAD(P)H-hydrate dehydratase / NAD(P)H-hydrate epimerase
MRLAKASEMQEMDRKTIEDLGIPGMVLMENAGRGSARFFLEQFSPSAGQKVLVVCGSGNNGGDGYVVARYLHQADLKPRVLVLTSLDRISGDARANLEIIQRMDMEIQEVPGPEKWDGVRPLLQDGDYIVDAILGTGLNTPVRGLYATAIEWINAAGKPVLSIDMPSGLNADSGRIMGTAVKADLTVTFGFPKPGQCVFPGAERVGRLVRIDIGIPEAVAESVPGRFTLTEPADFADGFGPEKGDTHKGIRGHLLVLAGSTGKTGAAALTALGGLRGGAGLVTLGIPESLNAILEVKLTEVMTVPLPETGTGHLSQAAWEDVEALFRGKTALAIGPGLSTHPETVELVRKTVSKCPLPMVIDADGLNAIGRRTGVLEQTAHRTVLTPHPGEMARLTGIQAAEIQRDRIKAADQFIGEHKCFLVLKGARTLVGTPAGKLYVNPTGNPALASGGTGDVLTGLIAGLLARGFSMKDAAIAGPYIHGLAADLLSEYMGVSGVLAGQLLTVMPEIIDALRNEKWPLKKPPLHGDFYQTL